MAIHTKKEFNLVAAGDAMITRPITGYEGNSDKFDDMLEILRNSDTTVLNLETVVHDFEYPAEIVGGTSMRTPPEVIEDLVGMGCDMVSTANNHIFDYGLDGLRSTMTALRSNGIKFAGTGENLYEAQMPAFLESPAGRVALISTSTKITKGSEASHQTSSSKGRPGVNPFHIELIQYLANDELEMLKSIGDLLGWEEIKSRWRDAGFYTGHEWQQDDYYHFGDMKFKEAKDESEVGFGYQISENHLSRITDSINEATKTADWVILSLHSHFGYQTEWGRAYDGEITRDHSQPPEFISEIAKSFIDSGADVVIGTGPHELHGIEIYREKPIFYSLGNFIIQRQTVPRFPPHMYERYDLDISAQASAIFDRRNRYPDGRRRGDLANQACWESMIPICSFSEEGTLNQCNLYPVTLQRSAPRSQRGIPVLADSIQSESIIERVSNMSRTFGTNISFIDGKGVLSP